MLIWVGREVRRWRDGAKRKKDSWRGHQGGGWCGEGDLRGLNGSGKKPVKITFSKSH